MLKKIHIGQVLRNHLSTLKNDNSQKPEFDDFFTFLIVPAVVASLLVYFKIGLKESAINIIIATLSILVGLLFNVIVLIFDIIKRDASKRLKNTILKELLANISFTILLSIVAILFTIITYVDIPYVKIVSTWLVYFLLSVFLFTVLMVLKRMYLLFKNEIDEIEREAENNKENRS